jgi:hypothetical protein
MSSSTHPTTFSEHPLASKDWTPDELAKRVFALALVGLACVGLAFVLVGLVGRSF